MELKDRLKTVRGTLRQEDFAEMLGVSTMTVGRWERGERTPDAADLQRILTSFPQVSPAWLVAGEGDMRRGAAGAATEPATRYADAADLEREYVLVPRYNVRVSAGGGSLVESEQVVDHLAFKADWIRSKMHINPADLLLISAMGDSMYPTIRDGDLLLVDKSQVAVRDDAIYIMRLDDSLIAKRLQKLYDGSIQVKSDNKQYDAQLVPAGKVELLAVIGRVVWIGGRV